MLDMEVVRTFEEATEETRNAISNYLIHKQASQLERFVAHVNIIGVIIKNMCETKADALRMADAIVTEIMLIRKIDGRDLDNAEILEMYEEMFRAQGVPIEEDELKLLGELIDEHSNK